MTEQHPITLPSEELVRKWIEDRAGGAMKGPVTWDQLEVATQAAQWGANQELEACCEFLDDNELCDPDFHKDLRNHRRPSLKEQALRGLKEIGDFTLGEFEGSSGFEVFQTHVDNIRRALEEIPE